MSDFELVTLKSGVKSLRSTVHGETFHPGTGPVIEANILHVQQQKIVERSLKSKKFVLWDVGFGAAANVIAAIEALQSSPTLQSLNSSSKIEIHSFDKTTVPIEFTLKHAEELGYVAQHREILETLIQEKEVKLSPSIHWRLHLGDFAEALKSSESSLSYSDPDSIFYDPYSPVGNCEMWTLDHFQNLRKRIESKSCLLTNYTRSTSVRVTLLLAGFYVGSGCEIGEKAETTVFSTDPSLLEKPLDRKWLDRVRVSINAAPLRMKTYTTGPILPLDFDLLQAAPQFSSS